MAIQNQEMRPLTLQEVFNNALFGIREQGYVKCVDSGNFCQYRTPSAPTMACGLGHSMPDSVFETRVITAGICTLVENFDWAVLLFGQLPISALSRLQNIHDWMRDAEGFEDRMKTFCDAHNLIYTPVGERFSA